MKSIALFKTTFLYIGILAGSLNICSQSDQLMTLDWEGIDSTTNPTEDFYKFSSGNWQKNNPIPTEESRWSNFNVLDKKNNEILKEIIEDVSSSIHQKQTIEQLIGDFYFSFIDTLTRNKLGVQPIQEQLLAIQNAKTKTAIEDQIIALHKKGISNSFSTYIGQDSKLNDQYIVYLSQTGQGLSSKDYYTNKDQRSKKIRKEYLAFIDNMFKVIFPNTKKPSKSIFALEARLLEKSRTPVENRDLEKRYNKMTMGDLAKLAPQFNWSKYLGERSLMVDSIIVSQPEYFTNFAWAFEKYSLSQWKAYLQWCVIRQAANHLSMDIERMNFDFYGKIMKGVKSMKPLYQRGLETISASSLGEALGQLFVKRNFSEDAQAKVNEMVDNIIIVFEERINQLDWMSEETKVKAQEKLASFSRKLGFPEVWKDFSTLQIIRNNFAINMQNLAVFRINESIEKLGKPVDKNEWYMNPQTVNAYYSPTNNEIVFPAGIMQPPFFNIGYEDAVNYARMGAVIGHELTHGFDDNGSRFDAKGSMKNWWKDEDRNKFDAKTQLLINQYNAFEVLDGVFVNGKLTLGENIADLGGLTIAYYAFLKSLEGKESLPINGYSPQQRFFIAFGQVWQNNIRDDELRNRIKNDSHSPGKYRVNGTLSNMPEFFEAFEVEEGDPMRQPADKIARIW